MIIPIVGIKLVFTIVFLIPIIGGDAVAVNCKYRNKSQVNNNKHVGNGILYGITNIYFYFINLYIYFNKLKTHVINSPIP